MEPVHVAPVDAGYLSMDASNTTGNVTLVLSLAGDLTLPALRAHVQDRLPLLPELRRVLHEVAWGMDRPWWVDDSSFDLGQHLAEHRLPNARGREADDAIDGHIPDAVREAAARVLMTPLDRSRPLWRLDLVRAGRTGSRRAFLCVTIHHAMADGTQFLHVLRTLFDAHSHPAPQGDTWVATPAPADAELLRRSAAESIDWIWRNTVAAAGSIAGTVGHQAWQNLVTASTQSAPVTPFNKTLSADRAWGVASVSIAASQAVRRRLGVTLNDLLHAMVAEALRDWMLARRALPAAPLVVLVPKVAAGTGPDPAALNRIEMGVSTLPTHVSDPVARLKTIHSAMRQAKDAPLFTETVMDLAARMSSASTSPLTRYAADLAVQFRVMDYVPTGTNLVISNVSMGTDRYEIAGVEVTHVHPLSPLSNGQGMFVTTQGYRGHLDMGVTSCPALMPDVQEVVDAMVGCYDRLCALG
ncbi:MAG: DUF1298 domain-containing protein [Actinomycetales bacterium]|nr:DUF1298 domain-containing protein [Actinomycetales bacterium]